MKKTDLLIGTLIAIAATAVGVFLYIGVFMVWLNHYTFEEGLRLTGMYGNMGKVITLGAILNIAIFFFLLKKNKDLMARGVVFGTILLALVTLFI